MPSGKKRNIFTYLGKVTLVALLIVLLVRTFFIEPYSISSSQMENALLRGDRLFVDKTAYGIRLPITILNIPFAFDSLLGIKSYSSVWELPYKRIFVRNLGRNDIVLFNSPAEVAKPLDKRKLILSRCVALPGDSIFIKDGCYFINGKQYVFSPDRMQEYYFKSLTDNQVDNILTDLDISLRNFRTVNDTSLVLLSRYEASLIKQNIVDTIAFGLYDNTDSEEYKFVVPQKGRRITVNKSNMIIYKQAILAEQGKATVENNNSLFINDNEQFYYTFRDDYFWVLSDNTSNASDSRSLGFIPFSNVIGKARFVWYSSDNGNPRWNRSFSIIK